MIIPVIVLFVVFILIAARHIADARLQMFQLKVFKRPLGKIIKLQIWHIMLFGAAVVLIAGQISPLAAAQSINLDVILFLFGMFVIGCALEESGYLSHLSYKLFSKARNADHLLLIILFGIGFAAAFLMNDTLAIIGTPVVLMLARNHKLPPKMLLIALAFAVTIGSAMSPIGNPQNLLIALGGGIPNPFLTFFGYLLVPTLVNFFAAYFLIKIFYKKDIHQSRLAHEKEPIKDMKLAFLSKISLVLMGVLIAFKIALVFFHVDFRLTYIALVSMLPVLLSRKRFEIIHSIDWRTLAFFASMFVLMESVWQSGFFQGFISSQFSIPFVLSSSVVVSQFVSNVPLVALFLPLLTAAGVTAKQLVALGAGSTIAGNLFILGAASNVIIIQNAEKKGETLTFWEFAKVGIPLTVINIIVYWIFLSVL